MPWQIEMEVKKILLCVSDFENRFDVDQVSFEGESLWPLLRSSIISQLRADPNNPLLRTSISKKFIGIFEKICIVLLIPMAPFWMLKCKYFSSKNIYIGGISKNKMRLVTELIGNPFFLSLQFYLKLMNEKIRFLGLSSYLYRSSLLLFYILEKRKIMNVLSKSEDFIENIAFHFEMKKTPFIPTVRHEIKVFVAAHRFFRYILSNRKIKNIFYVTYYSPTFMALNLAACKVGVRNIEIQHGLQGEIHPFYVFNHINQCGYALLPKVFWLWSKNELKYKKFLENSKYHEYLIGGHPALVYAKTRKKPRLSGRDKIVLFVGQVETEIDRVIPSFILKALLDLKKAGFKIFLRMHPLVLKYTQNVENILSHQGVEVLEPSFEPLYEQLQRVDYMITLGSSTAYEATAFKTKIIIASPRGYHSMKSNIESGLFMYAATTEEIVTAVQSNKNREHKTNDDFLQLSEKKLIAELESII